MKDTFTNKELSAILDISLTKVRRLAKDFLPPDPGATLQSGKARKHYKNEAFEIYLAHHLITEMKFKIAEARAILTDISPWARNAGQYPEHEPEIALDEYIHEEYGFFYPAIVHIMTANTDSGFFYKAHKIVSEKKINRDGKTVTKVEFIEEQVIEPPRGKKLLTDEFNVRILDLGKLCGRFNYNLNVFLGHPAVF